MTGSYRQIDHTGDLGIEVFAPDARGLFSTSAEAMFHLLAPDAAVEPSGEVEIAVEAPDHEMLLVRWLSELLYLHVTGPWLFGEFQIRDLALEGTPCRLLATARGEPISPGKHDVQIELKAVTYHQLELREGAGGEWKARIVFDI